MIFNSSDNSFLATPYLRDNFIRINIFFSLLANFFLWLFLIAQTKAFAGLIPLHYNIYFGIDAFGPWHQIFLLPGLGFSILLINFILAKFTYSGEKILSYFLAGSASFSQIIFAIATIFIILINY